MSTLPAEAPHDYLWLVGPEWDDQERAWARDDLISFVRRMFPAYHPAWFHFVIAAKLRAVLDGTIRRLLIVMPPRHGKSTLCSRYFPAWYLGNRPDHRIIAVSYADRLAYRFGRFTRNVMQDRRYPFPITLARDSRSAEQWDIEGHAGGYLASGVGGSITGEGANVLLIDDPTKGAQEADSEAHRERTIEWYTETAYPRLEAGGAIVLIGTRWREDDLIGYVLARQAQGGDVWDVLHLPAIDDHGQPLWPERFGLAELERRRANMSARAWDAQYQGRPSPPEGAVFKRHWLTDHVYRRADLPHPNLWDDLIQSWDMTFKETKAGSYVVGQVWMRHGADYYLLDQYRQRVDFPGALAAVRAMSARWPATRAKLVEATANGPAVVATLRSEIPGLIEVPASGGKEARANAVSHLLEAGNVHIPDLSEAPWVADFLAEVTAFPYGQHDDQVDAMTQALMRLSPGRMQPVAGETLEVLEEWFG